MCEENAESKSGFKEGANVFSDSELSQGTTSNGPKPSLNARIGCHGSYIKGNYKIACILFKIACLDPIIHHHWSNYEKLFFTPRFANLLIINRFVYLFLVFDPFCPPNPEKKG